MATTQLAEHQASLSNSLKRTTQAITAIVGESAKVRLLPDVNCRSCNPDKMPVDDVKVRIDPFRFGGLIFDPRLSLHSEHGAVCPISVGLSTFKLVLPFDSHPASQGILPSAPCSKSVVRSLCFRSRPPCHRTHRSASKANQTGLFPNGHEAVGSICFKTHTPRTPTPQITLRLLFV